MDVGAVFGIKRPLPTAVFPTLTDPVTGKVTVLPLVTPITDSSGKPLYTYTDPTGVPQTTTCPAGLPDSTGACNGVTPNSALNNTVSPFLERFLGDSPKPRLSIGFGVNWNSPFGPLRIDIAKALLHQKGDDTKLVTFNVGTQF
jgi:outer membrane protein insertion porin family